MKRNKIPIKKVNKIINFVTIGVVIALTIMMGKAMKLLYTLMKGEGLL